MSDNKTNSDSMHDEGLLDTVMAKSAAPRLHLKRREFISLVSASAVYYAMNPTVAFASPSGPSPKELYARLVPRDKGLKADWLASLVARGHPLDESIQYTSRDGIDLEVIGMTAGGIGCGTVYLSGDGQLWVWDILNLHNEGVVPNRRPKPPEGLETNKKDGVPERNGANFINPPRASEKKMGVDARFTLKAGGHEFPLNASGWEEVAFTGRWPIARVDYASSKTPLKVSLEAGSPFIPLNLKDSSIPVTILDYTVENPTDEAVTISIEGHLNNPAGQYTGLQHLRRTEVLGEPGVRGIYHSLASAGEENASTRSNTDAGSMVLAVLGSDQVELQAEKNTVEGTLTVPAHGTATLRFAITWHFPNLAKAVGGGGKKRHYTTRYDDARGVVRYVAQHQSRLMDLTQLWVRTWNDSSLPQWLLDRSILPANTLQTENCFFFEDGRFWAWEGIGCCHGTCGHVWKYAQGHARLFPEIERNLRERTDFGIAQYDNGAINFRADDEEQRVAIDAQAGYILRTLRDHQLTDDPDYLKRVWEPAKKAIRYLIDFDAADDRGGLDGLLDGRQHNTLDAEWYGKVHVLCSMYLASLRAAEELANAMRDEPLAKELHGIYVKGRRNIEQLFNGEFYEQLEDPEHLDAIGVGKGCYIDQVMGQYWANQVGLGRLYHADHQKSALRALWTYNFIPDYGPFRQGFRQGRYYGLSGDAGLLMCTWPLGGLRSDFKKHWQYMYFNEFMTGFEYQVAAHMVAERDSDLVEKGLAITRSIHDRYSARHGRNPYNEIECSDHYARAGSAYAVFLAVCGFEYDQSRGRLAFNPVIQVEDFKAPFTTSRAWGTFEQKPGKVTLTLTHGELSLNELQIGQFKGKRPGVTLNGSSVSIDQLHLKDGDILELTI